MRGSLLIILLLVSLVSLGTHNRAGEISFKQIGVNQFEMTLVTYTVPPLTQEDADRPIIEIFWGDGSRDSIARSIDFPKFITSGVNKNEYKGIHTYPGPGNYTVSLQDPNRNADIVNIPNSVNTIFYIESQIIINPFLGENISPVLLNPPVEDACINAVFQHNPSAFDSNGDSLAFTLVEGKGLDGSSIQGYTFPSGVSVDVNSGTLTWEKPNAKGEFNFAILIKEYRDGFLIGSIIRDMQVSVKDCNNSPPIIEETKDLCLEAGTLLNLDIKAKESDPGQAITLTASGGPLSEVNGNLALFSEVIGIDSVDGNLNWITGCSHVRSYPYQIFFKAQDNDDEVQLIDLQTLNIRIIGPEVKNVSAESTLEGITISWKRSICEEVIGYQVYRKSDSSDWQPDSCEIGVPSYTGYNLVGTLVGRNTDYFLDSDLIDRNKYCYRIVSIFPDGSKSISSEQICAETFEAKPIPTHADVLETDSLNGSIMIRWEKPKNLDSLNLSKNAFYRLYTFNEDAKTEIFITPNLDSSNYLFQHDAINTKSEQHSYAIELIDIIDSQKTIISTSEKFSSVFLSGVPADKTVKLSWEYYTPWKIDSSLIINHSGFIDNVLDTVYSSYLEYNNLTNNIEYCYVIRTLGGYSSKESGLTQYRNHSQKLCITPKDIIPPCLPEITSYSSCDSNQNLFHWAKDTLECNGDLTELSVFFKRYPEEEYSLLFTNISPWKDTAFADRYLSEVAGCYAFSATDSIGNTSQIKNEICFDNCPRYQLPNIFTPNGDEFNETFIPFPFKYVERVDLKIYNRWGQIIFKTDNPFVNWNGKSRITNLPCSSGIYYYSCIVTEQRLNGYKNRIVNGFVHLLKD